MQPRITRTTETTSQDEPQRRAARSVIVRLDDLGQGRYRVRGPSGSAIVSTSGGFVRAITGALNDRGRVPPAEPAEAARSPRRLRGHRPGDGWGQGQQRPDVHPPDRWTPLADGAWLSPAGRTYGPDTAQARRCRARLGDGVVTTDTAATHGPLRGHVATTDSGATHRPPGDGVATTYGAATRTGGPDTCEGDERRTA